MEVGNAPWIKLQAGSSGQETHLPSKNLAFPTEKNKLYRCWLAMTQPEFRLLLRRMIDESRDIEVARRNGKANRLIFELSFSLFPLGLGIIIEYGTRRSLMIPPLHREAHWENEKD
jgi:hypothetical protein